MIKVYIWNFRGKSEAWGHASMSVNSQYISWWPDANRTSSKINENVYSAHPIGNRSLADDIKAEGSYPNSVVVINGLDEANVLAWWRKTALSFGGGKSQGPPSIPWSSLGWNCAKVVATALKEGGGNEYSSLNTRWNMVWTPNDALKYASSIAEGLVKDRVK